MAKYKFFREDGNKLICDANYMEVYIPDFYLKEGIAKVIGNSIETLGIFNFKIFASKEDKEGHIYRMTLPISILLNYGASYKVEKKLSKELDKDVYVVLQLEKGDVFVKELNVKQDGGSTSGFVKLLHSGKLPAFIPYSQIISVYHNNLDINAVNLDTPSSTLEFIICELYRSKKNPEIPFRREIGQNNAKVGEMDYKPANLKNLAAINSTFTALSFENMNQSIISSVKKSRDNSKENVSPVEKTIKY